MQPIQLFELASRQAEWLSVRQSVVAGNIANANTVGYRAKDVTPFSSVLEQTGVKMAATHAAHFTDTGSSADDIGTREAALTKSIGVQESGNSVGLAEELMKSGQIKREAELANGLIKSFHRMMLMTVRK